MPYFPSLNDYLHQSSLLIQAYHDTRITTRYSLPKKPRRSKKKPTSTEDAPEPSTQSEAQPKRDPSATLTLKTFHPGSGICLKYKTDKAAEVGRLMTGLGKLAKGELIEMPTTTSAEADKMDLDGPLPGETGVKTEDKVVLGTPSAGMTAGQQPQQQGGGGGKKKKKGKK